MPKSTLVFIVILFLLLPACNSTITANSTLPEPASTEIPVATLPPPTATFTPSPLPPTATATEVVAQATRPEPTPTSSPSPAPSPEPTPTLTPIPDWLNSFGRTADNLMYLGNPDAPVVMIDFSDFM